MSKAAQIATLALHIAKHVKSAGSIIWGYFKVEAAPPMTIAMLNGPLGKSIETTAGNVIDGVIKALAQQIRNIEQQAIRAAKAKEMALKAQLLKQKEEEKKKDDERKAAAAAAAKEIAEEAKKVAAAKAAEASPVESKVSAEMKKGSPKKSESKDSKTKSDKKPKK